MWWPTKSPSGSMLACLASTVDDFFGHKFIVCMYVSNFFKKNFPCPKTAFIDALFWLILVVSCSLQGRMTRPSALSLALLTVTNLLRYIPAFLFEWDPFRGRRRMPLQIAIGIGIVLCKIKDDSKMSPKNELFCKIDRNHKCNRYYYSWAMTACTPGNSLLVLKKGSSLL